MTSLLGPVELTALIKPESEVEAQRHLFCGSYDACLEQAVDKGWTSWSCARCAMFPDPELPAGLRRDGHRPL